jgi:uncharacterized protein
MIGKLIIAGGSGLIGKRLITHLSPSCTDIVVLSRSESKDFKTHRRVHWDGAHLGEWSKEFKDADVLINLSGKSIQCRFTAANKKLLLDSRISSTRVLSDAILFSGSKIHTWLNASGAAIYPQRFEEAVDESVQEVGKGFLAELSQDWEAEFYRSEMNLRKIALRITPVLDEEEGALPTLKKICSLRLGGAQGSGKQMMSWIHQEDFCRAISFLIKHTALEGPVNLSSPDARSNEEFMATLRNSMDISFGLPAPKLAIELGSIFSGVDPSLILDSSFVAPRKLLEADFRFTFPKLEAAFADILNEG